MKTIGMLGGMSWQSTSLYYQQLNELVAKNLGGLHSAKIVMFSVDFDPIEKLQHKGDWEGAAKILSKAAQNIEAGGADFLLICTNTMHKLYPEISASINIPILHLADATAEKLIDKNIKKVGLLGTGFTMEQDFYKGRLSAKFGLEVIVPNEADRKIVHDVIYNELCEGEILDASKQHYIHIIEELHENGAEAVILGCTEIGMLVKQEDTQVPLFDTTAIHVEKAVEFALKD